MNTTMSTTNNYSGSAAQDVSLSSYGLTGSIRPFYMMKQSENAYASMVERENSAKMLAGGLIGDCYLLMEIIDGLMTEALVKFREYPWYRQTMKHDFRMARQKIHESVQQSVSNSCSNDGYMRAVADGMCEVLRFDIYGMENGLMIALGKAGIKDADMVAKMCVIDILLQYTNVKYDDILKHCSTIYGDYEFYDSWYNNASCRSPKYWWEKAVDAYNAKYIKGEIDLNKVSAITDGLRIITKKMNDRELCEQLKAEAAQECEPGNGQELYEHALDVLNLGKDSA